MLWYTILMWCTICLSCILSRHMCKILSDRCNCDVSAESPVWVAGHCSHYQCVQNTQSNHQQACQACHQDLLPDWTALWLWFRLALCTCCHTGLDDVHNSSLQRQHHTIGLMIECKSHRLYLTSNQVTCVSCCTVSMSGDFVLLHCGVYFW